MPTWLVENKADFDRFLNEQLKKLQTDHIDFYLLHGLRKTRWPDLVNFDVFDWAERAIDNGMFDYFGFSFHDNYQLFKEIIDSYNSWTFCQIQYNYMDTEYQAGIKGLKYAASKGLAVVIMEPILGGRLVVPPPKEIQDIWNETQVKRTLAEWALQWVWNHQEVSVVLSGMSTMTQVVENIKSASRSRPGILTDKELDTVRQVQQKYRELGFPVRCVPSTYFSLRRLDPL